MPKIDMPSSLRFVVILLGLAGIGGMLALAVLGRQDTQRARLVAEQSTGGNVAAGEKAMSRLGCGTCHSVGRVTGPRGQVGPALDGFGSRAQIAGRLVNEPSNLVRWLRHPQEVVPGNGMPDQGLGEADARDLAAYLYTLRDD